MVGYGSTYASIASNVTNHNMGEQQESQRRATETMIDTKIVEFLTEACDDMTNTYLAANGILTDDDVKGLAFGYGRWFDKNVDRAQKALPGYQELLKEKLRTLAEKTVAEANKAREPLVEASPEAPGIGGRKTSTYKRVATDNPSSRRHPGGNFDTFADKSLPPEKD